VNSQLVAFLEGSGTDSRSRRLEDIWQFDDDEIEYTHDFIQWIFPLREASGSNFSAPTLLASEIEVIRSSDQCQQNLETSASWILSFFKRTEEVVQFANHNHLRVTRIIKSLRLLHSDQLANQFKQEVLTMIQERQALINPVTVAFWLES
jgi:hypothetical protein